MDTSPVGIIHSCSGREQQSRLGLKPAAPLAASTGRLGAHRINQIEQDSISQDEIMNTEKGNPVKSGPSIHLTSIPPSIFHQVFVLFSLSAGTLVHARLSSIISLNIPVMAALGRADFVESLII